MDNRSLHVCFVAPTAYAAISGRDDLTHIGGAQVQQALVARELVRRGHRVSFIVHDYGQPDAIEHAGITAWKMCSPDAGLPVIRFVHPRWTSLTRAMSRCGAEVFIQRGAGAETGQVARWCRAHGKPLVFFAASDSDVNPALPYLPTRRERALYRHGLRHATRVVAQTLSQSDALRRSFHIEADIIRSGSEDPGFARDGAPDSSRPARVLWVGRFSYEKRPELMLDLAEACLGLQFDVAGASNTGTGSSDRSAATIERAGRLSNVTLHGWVARGKMNDLYAQADILLCTSMWEGFPNTFMEAWARGVPTVSTVDPDNVITENRLGGVGKTCDELARSIDALLDYPEAWLACSRRAKAFFLEHHSLSAAAEAYEKVLLEVTARNRSGEMQRAVAEVRA